MRQRDRHDLGAHIFQTSDRAPDRGFDLGLHPVNEVFAWNPDAQTAHSGVHLRGVVGHRGGDRGGIARVVAGNRLQEQGAVAHVFGDRTDLIQGRCVRYDPEAADAPVAGLQADDAAKRRGQPNRAAGIGAERGTGLIRGDRGRGAAGRAARHPVGIPRVAARRIGRILVGRAHCELVAVGLTHDHRARVSEPSGNGCVVRRNEVFENFRAGCRSDAACEDHVLERDRNPAQRGGWGTRGQHLVGGFGLTQRGVGTDVQVGVQTAVGRLNSVENGTRQLHRAQFAGGQFGLGFRNRERTERHGCYGLAKPLPSRWAKPSGSGKCGGPLDDGYSMILGTRKKSAFRSGAFTNKASVFA